MSSQSQSRRWRPSSLGNSLRRRDLLRGAAGAGIALATMPAFAGSVRADTSTTAVVTDVLNLRAGPDGGAAILAVLPAGATVQRIGPAQGQWVPVRAGGVDGWVDGDYLSTAAAPPTPAAGLAGGQIAQVTTDGLNVRGGPDPRSPVVGSLPAGASVDLLSASPDGSWWRVGISPGQAGYVSAAFLSPTGAPIASGIFDLDLPIPYAPQLDPIWCDPADLQMWRAYRQNLPPGGDAALQSAIWSWETSHNDGYTVDQWDCSPFAVASAAHHWMSDAGFNHFRYDDALAGSRLLAWLTANPSYREPSIALIWQGEHYVLVRGVRADRDPSADPGGVQIYGFYVADPDASAGFWLGQDRFIPLDTWLGQVFTPATYLTPHTGVPGDPWQQRCVAIQRAPSAGGPTPDGVLNAAPSLYGA